MVPPLQAQLFVDTPSLVYDKVAPNASRSMQRARVVLFRVAISIVGVLGALLILEIGVRISAALDRNYFDEIVAARELKKNGELTLGDMIRLNPDNRIVYDLRPGTHGVFRGQEVTINSYGSREEERKIKKPRGVFRIVGLGDSQMFGWGVRQDETFLAILERELGRRFPDRRFEVWNLAVPGYNTVQEVETFATKADELAPDLVVINWVDNDVLAPDFLVQRPNLWSLRRSFLRELIRRRRALLRGKDIVPIDLLGIGLPGDPQRERRVPQELQQQYKALGGWENMVAALQRLAALAKGRRIRPVLLLNWNDYEERLSGRTSNVLPLEFRELAEFCKGLGYLVVDPQDRVVDYLQKNRLGDLALWVSPQDPHPSAVLHWLVAEELAAALQRANALSTPATTVLQDSPAGEHRDQL